MCGGNSTVGSNPTGTATENPRLRGGFLASHACNSAGHLADSKGEPLANVPVMPAGNVELM